jgi:hypothetical protein
MTDLQPRRARIFPLLACLLFLSGWGIASAFAADAASAAGEDRPLRLLAGPEGGQWNKLGQMMEKLFTDAGIPVKNEVGGGVQNLYLVGEEEADIGFTLYSFMGAAEVGEKELPSVNLDNAVLLANLYPQVLYIIVRKEIADRHGLKTLADLLKVSDPLRFATLPKGTGSEFIFNMMLRNAYRTSYDQLAEQGWNIGYMSYAEITRLFLAGELDVCAYTAGPGTFLVPALEEKNLDAVLLPVDDDMLNLMTHQFMTITYVIRKGDYESVNEDIMTLGDYSSLVIRSALPEDLVYRLNEVLWKNRDTLAEVTEDMKQFSPRFAIAGQGKVHPGSQRFWNSPEMQELRSK